MDIEQIRIRIMSEAYDLADRGDLEGYNAIKVMCSDVLKLISAVAAEKEKQIIDILERLQERNESHNYYAYAINVIKSEPRSKT